MLFKPKLVGNDPQNGLAENGKQRNTGKHDPGMRFIQADYVRKPDGQERETGRHNEKVEKEKQAKNPEIRVIFMGTGRHAHCVFLKGTNLMGQRVPPRCHGITRVQSQSKWRFPGRGSAGLIRPAPAIPR
ncbi:hypothetical protein D3C75_668890 [compost metagenome]